VLTHLASLQNTSAHVEALLKSTAVNDSRSTKITVPQDPGSGGKSYAETLERLLSGFEVEKIRPSADKVTRAKPASAMSEQGKVKLVRGHWNEAFLEEVESFGENGVGHDDIVDSFSDLVVSLEGMPASWKKIFGGGGR
jgi:predicted phage terminase large subunit-like protein